MRDGHRGSDFDISLLGVLRSFDLGFGSWFGFDVDVQGHGTRIYSSSNIPVIQL
jgi:hypothetical protein